MLGRALRVSRSAVRGALLHATRGTHEISPTQLDTVTDLLCDLRGLAVKVGQWLAEEDDLLPAEVRAALATSYRDVSPMHDSELNRVFREDFVDTPESIFGAFERVPFAAASIGQVHRADHRVHGALAVKVQYPGLAESIRSDLRVLEGAMTITPWARRHRRVLGEIHARFLEELDYRNEAANLVTFRTRLAPLGIEVPRVFHDLCSPRVLAMGFLGGQPIRTWASAAPAAEIDRVASLAYAAWNAGFVEHGCFHADPSPGNLLVEDGRLQVVDLGCTRSVSRPVAELMRVLLRSPERAGTGATLPLYRELGVMPGARGAGHAVTAMARSTYEALLAPLELWLAGPAREGGLDFRAQHDWPVRGRDALARLVRDGDALGVHDEFVFLFRAYHALFRLFQHMGAHVRATFPERST